MGKKIMKILLASLALFTGLVNIAWAQSKNTDSVSTITVADYRYNDQAPVGYFEVNGVDGKNHIAFCGWHEKKMPEKGWEMSTIEIYTAENKKNENLRKVLWYGFDGPGDIGANYAQTALAASVALGHMDTDDTGETEGPIGKTFLNQVKKMETPPDEFQVYCVRNLEETDYKYQCLVYAVYEPQGEILITKESSNAEIVSNNSCYSLQNAVYGIFADRECLEQVAEMKTDFQGKTKSLSLKKGTYFVKELEAPQGYLKDDETYEIQVISGEVTNLNIKEEPYVIEVEELLAKYDAELGYEKKGNRAQGAATLEGAEYEVDFYGEYFESIEQLQGKEPLKTWNIKTSAEGKINFDEQTFFPLGTIVIREKSASRGYLVNEEIILRNITMHEELEIIQAAEDIIRGNVEIMKYAVGNSDESRQPMAGVEFCFTSKTNGKSYYITTNEEGFASTESIKGLLYDTYIVTETNTPTGYAACEPFEICISENKEVLSYEIENEQMELPDEPKEEIVNTGDVNTGVRYVILALFALGVLIRCCKKRNTP